MGTYSLRTGPAPGLEERNKFIGRRGAPPFLGASPLVAGAPRRPINLLRSSKPGACSQAREHRAILEGNKGTRTPLGDPQRSTVGAESPAHRAAVIKENSKWRPSVKKMAGNTNFRFVILLYNCSDVHSRESRRG